MTPQTEAAPKSKEPAAVQHRRLSVVYFNRSVVLCGTETESAGVPPKEATGHRPGNSVDSAAAAWLAADGSIGEDDLKRPSDGVVFRKRTHDSHKNQRIVSQTFVPWSNIRCVAYGAE